mgnify:CR=1 FL=1
MPQPKAQASGVRPHHRSASRKDFCRAPGCDEPPRAARWSDHHAGDAHGSEQSQEPKGHAKGQQPQAGANSGKWEGEKDREKRPECVEQRHDSQKHDCGHWNDSREQRCLGLHRVLIFAAPFQAVTRRQFDRCEFGENTLAQGRQGYTADRIGLHGNRAPPVPAPDKRILPFSPQLSGDLGQRKSLAGKTWLHLQDIHPSDVGALRFDVAQNNGNQIVAFALGPDNPTVK